MNAEHARSATAPSRRIGLVASPLSLLRTKGSGAPSARRVPLLGLLVLAAFALLALTAPSALAARGHVFKGTFGTPGTGPGQLKEPSAVAVNEASGDVYVLDQGNSRVDKFGPAGNFIRAFLSGLRIGAPA